MSSDSNVFRKRLAQNFLLVWLDANIDLSENEYQQPYTKLQKIVNNINTFTDLNLCFDFIKGIDQETIFIIVSESFCQELLPIIDQISAVTSIFIVSTNLVKYEEWANKWIKIKGIYKTADSICDTLKLIARQCNQDFIPVSFISINEKLSNENLNQLESSFMYTQLFKEILVSMRHQQQSIKDLAVYCRALHVQNKNELEIINEFENNYKPQFAIWWYTRECFTYQMLNRSLRLLESDTIINMGIFIRDLHRQIQQLHQQQISSYHGQSFIVYRGQGLSRNDFEKLSRTKGGLMSFNNFLSTSKNSQTSLSFAKMALTRPDTVGVLFEMSIDPTISTTPYASISDVSYFKEEEEILFSMHTVFRIGAINRIDNCKQLYQVILKLTADDDEQLCTITRSIREKTVGATGWERLGNLLVQIGQYNKAEELYRVLIEQTSNINQKALYYNNLGYVKSDQGDYKSAISYYEKGLEIRQQCVPDNHSSLATSYNNIAGVYYNIGNYPEALSFFEKALEIRLKSFPPDHPDLASSFNNIATLYYNIGEYSKALSFYEETLKIRQKALPVDHPDLATTYNNIASVYKSMEENSKALSFYEKALQIRQKTLPKNHPSLSFSYNNIAGMYESMKQYSQALLYYEKSLEIMSRSHSENHPDTATCYNNLASVYDSMGEYEKAISYHEKAINIRRNVLPHNHSDLAISYNNLAGVYANMNENVKALSFFQLALTIWQQIYPENHPHVKSVRKNIEIINEKHVT